MNKLDACVGDLVEWYDYQEEVVFASCTNMILVYDDKQSYCLFSSLWGFHKVNYQQKKITILPRKIK